MGRPAWLALLIVAFAVGPVEEAINCLAPDSSYHYRLVAVNGTEKTYGNDRTFKTKPWQGGSRKVVYQRCPAGKPMK